MSTSVGLVSCDRYYKMTPDLKTELFSSISNPEFYFDKKLIQSFLKCSFMFEACYILRQLHLDDEINDMKTSSNIVAYAFISKQEQLDQQSRLSTEEGDQQSRLPTEEGDQQSRLLTEEGDQQSRLPTEDGDQQSRLPTEEGNQQSRLSSYQFWLEYLDVKKPEQDKGYGSYLINNIMAKYSKLYVNACDHSVGFYIKQKFKALDYDDWDFTMIKTR